MVPKLHIHIPPLHLPENGWVWGRHDTVFGSGILCLISIHRRHYPPYHHTHSLSSAKFAFLNPVTPKFIFTNPIPPQLSSLIPLSDPSQLFLGFGALNSDYRVVVLIRYGLNYTSSFALVYSLISGQWKKTNSCLPQEPRIAYLYCNNHGQGGGGDLLRESFVSGCWHWMIRLEDRTAFRVLSFDFRDEMFRVFGMPEQALVKFPRIRRNKIFVLQERLAVMDVVFNGPYAERIQVWVMTKYGAQESWTSVYMINPPLMYGYLIRYLRIDCLKDATAAAGFVVETLFYETVKYGYGFEIVCCDHDGYRIVDQIRTG